MISLMEKLWPDEANRTFVDWSMLLLQLRKHYGSLERVSAELKCHRGWAAQLSRGEIKEPKFSDGVRLLDFARDHLPQEVFLKCVHGLK